MHHSDNRLACVMGNITQHGKQKMVEIESMTGAGYHQAMYHILECMRTSSIIERHTRQVCADSEFIMIIMTHIF